MADMTFNWPRLRSPAGAGATSAVGAEDIRDLGRRDGAQAFTVWRLAPTDRSPGAGSRCPPGYRAPWSRAFCGRAEPGSRGYPPSAQAGGWQNCASNSADGITVITLLRA